PQSLSPNSGRCDIFASLPETLTVDIDSIPYEIEGIDDIQRLDSELRLFDAEGNELLLVTGAAAPDEIFTANRDAYLEFTAEEDGTYYVGVAQLGNRTYNPLDATDGSGSGRIFPNFGINIGEYELTATLETETIVEPPAPELPVFGTLDGDTIDVLGSDELVFGGAENDTIDTVAGTGGNRVYGQSGDDTFILGSDDRALGGGGDDTFFFLGGESTATGGAGEEQFWIAVSDIPEAANVVTDFTSGEDVLGIAGFGEDFGFDDLSITQEDAGSLISTGGDELAKLLGVDASSLTDADFAFAPGVV
ncbi:calcium-binding protein, partial [Crocosphaera sp. Alani8]|uniref:calcium-binding protein n=1 Tax=Crocosphaera sp. Alani8 TaxID=3038952 RepID=UPI00314124F0